MHFNLILTDLNKILNVCMHKYLTKYMPTWCDDKKEERKNKKLWEIIDFYGS